LDRYNHPGYQQQEPVSELNKRCDANIEMNSLVLINVLKPFGFFEYYEPIKQGVPHLYYSEEGEAQLVRKAGKRFEESLKRSQLKKYDEKRQFQREGVWDKMPPEKKEEYVLKEDWSDDKELFVGFIQAIIGAIRAEWKRKESLPQRITNGGHHPIPSQFYPLRDEGGWYNG